jgi:predicted extracellular nuclease
MPSRHLAGTLAQKFRQQNAKPRSTAIVNSTNHISSKKPGSEVRAT